MLLAKDGRVRKLDSRTRQLPMPAGVTAWHPNGRLAAFSANKFRQFFHTRGDVREVLNYVSDVAILDTQTNEVFRCDSLCREEQLETYPAWSPDGRQLYFCSAPIRWPTDREVLPESVRAIRYSLMRIRYDAATNQWGEVETILSAQETDKSITAAKNLTGRRTGPRLHVPSRSLPHQPPGFRSVRHRPGVPPLLAAGGGERQPERVVA